MVYRYKYKKPHRYKRKKSILRSRFFWLGILVIFLAGAGFYFFIFSKTFQVEEIIITGEKKTSAEDIESLVKAKLDNKILFFKTKSIFWVDFKEIRNEILNEFPQISEVEFHRDLPDVLDVLIMERSGLAVWCGGDCFLLDNEGIIFEKIQAPEETGLIKITGGERVGSFSLGEGVIEKEKLDKILEMERVLKTDFKIPLKEISIPTKNRINVKTLEGWEIYFDSKEDLDRQFTKLRAILSEKNFSREREKLQYIDLRFEKAYYKYY